MTKPRIVVTGATGKTGSIVVSELLKAGYLVRAIVHREDGRSWAGRDRSKICLTGERVSQRTCLLIACVNFARSKPSGSSGNDRTVGGGSIPSRRKVRPSGRFWQKWQGGLRVMANLTQTRIASQTGISNKRGGSR
jgi:NmrA-like family